MCQAHFNKITLLNDFSYCLNCVNDFVNVLDSTIKIDLLKYYFQHFEVLYPTISIHSYKCRDYHKINTFVEGFLVISCVKY